MSATALQCSEDAKSKVTQSVSQSVTMSLIELSSAELKTATTPTTRLIKRFYPSLGLLPNQARQQGWFLVETSFINIFE